MNEINLVESFSSNHKLFLGENTFGDKTKNILSKKLAKIEKNLEKLNRLLEIENITSSHLLKTEEGDDLFISVKSVIGLHLFEKEDLNSFVDLASRINYILKEIHHEIKNKSSRENYLHQLQKIATQLEDNEAFYFFKLTNDKLGPEITKKTLQWIQRARLNLLKKTNDANTPELIQKVDRLEHRLIQSNKKPSEDFPAIVFKHPEIMLGKEYVSQIADGSEGMNPSYYVYDHPEKEKRKKVGVFKPSRKNVDFPFAEESLKRQIAAYLIDQLNGSKANVPLSLKANFQNKLGALQAFKKSQGQVGSLTDIHDINQIPASQVHFQAIHRLRLYDLDAHLNNFLWNYEANFELISIDHDCILPAFTSKDNLLDCNSTLRVAISEFPQMNVPFDAETLQSILSWNIPAEVALLKEMEFPKESIHLFKTISLFCQKAAEKGLLPGEIADYLISTNSTEKYELVRKMIDLQNELPNEFDEAIQKFIEEKCDDLAKNPSWRRNQVVG